MSLATGIQALATRIATEFNSIRTALNGKANTVHGHSLTDANITGVLPIAQAPTGTTSTTLALGNHGHSLTDAGITGVLPVAQLPAASETAIGGVERATAAEAQSMTDTTRYISPAGLANAAAMTATPSRLVRRDGNGRAEIETPATPSDIANKGYVDLAIQNDPSVLDLTIYEPARWAGPTGTALTVPGHVSPSGGQTTHPSILYFKNKWNGYHYWMGHTPYPNSNDDHEDPNIVVSQDGINWIQAPGVPAPLDDQDGTPEYNSDVNLVMGPNNVMYCFWRFYNTGTAGSEERMYVRTSANGSVWTSKVEIWNRNHTTTRYLSPSMIWEDDRWTMYAVEIVPSPNRVVRRQATVGLAIPTNASWGAETVCTLTGMQAGKEPWHLEVRKVGNQYVMLLNDCVTDSGQEDGDLVLFYSTNGTTFTGGGKPVIPRVKAGGHDRLYKATFVPAVQDGIVGFEVWYAGWLIGPPTVWNIFRTFISGQHRESGKFQHTTPSTGPNGTNGANHVITFDIPFATATPSITVTTDSGRIVHPVTARSATGMTIRVENWTSAATNNYWVYWEARDEALI